MDGPSRGAHPAERTRSKCYREMGVGAPRYGSYGERKGSAGGNVDWFFDGLGTLLIGLLVGGAGGTTVTWRIMSKRSRVIQKQRAGDQASQMQVGRDAKGKEL